MTSITEASANINSQISSVLGAGVNQLSMDDTVTFTLYRKFTMPFDGFIFWIKSDILSNSSMPNCSPPNSFYINQPQNIKTQAPSITVKGSFHYSIDRSQDIDETVDKNHITFTSLIDIDDFDIKKDSSLWIGEYNDLRFSFSKRLNLYSSANIYHYIGDAIYPALESQIVDDVRFFDSYNVVVSNSLPIWLSIITNWPIYAANRIPENIIPPYIAVNINEETQEALQELPYIDYKGSQWQLVRERVEFIIYGMRNFNVLDFQQYLQLMAIGINPLFGITNSPIPKEKIRTQPEISATAMKKTLEVWVNYYQQTARDLALKTIKKAWISEINGIPFNDVILEN